MASNRPTPTKAAPGSDVATRKGGTLTGFIETYQGDFARVMPAHLNVEAFVGLAAAYVRRDGKLRQAADVNPASLILALRECAALGHTPTPKIFALVPFNDKTAPGGKSIVGIETYHGVIERMYRAGGVQSVHSELVRANDLFRWDAMNQRVTQHEYDPFATEVDRGQLMGTYAWARLFTGGISQVVWMNREQVMKHKAVARTDAFWSGSWEPDMWRKTGLHGLERYVPTSAEYRWQVAMSANAGTSGFAGVPDVPVLDYGPSPDDDIQDAVVVPDETPTQPTRGRPTATRTAGGARGDQPGPNDAPRTNEGDARDPEPDPDTDPEHGRPDWPAVPQIPNGGTTQ